MQMKGRLQTNQPVCGDGSVANDIGGIQKLLALISQCGGCLKFSLSFVYIIHGHFTGLRCISSAYRRVKQNFSLVVKAALATLKSLY